MVGLPPTHGMEPPTDRQRVRAKAAIQTRIFSPAPRGSCARDSCCQLGRLRAAAPIASMIWLSFDTLSGSVAAPQAALAKAPSATQATIVLAT